MDNQFDAVVGKYHVSVTVDIQDDHTWIQFRSGNRLYKFYLHCGWNNGQVWHRTRAMRLFHSILRNPAYFGRMNDGVFDGSKEQRRNCIMQMSKDVMACLHNIMVEFPTCWSGYAWWFSDEVSEMEEHQFTYSTFVMETTTDSMRSTHYALPLGQFKRFQYTPRLSTVA